MAIKATILADSVSPQGKRITTFETTFPRFILAEFNTHRMLSRNAASSRAIPVEKMMQRVRNDPAMPVHWGANQKGMQAGEELSEYHIKDVKSNWDFARQDALAAVRQLNNIGLHKQVANRLLEPWMWITVICTATEYANFFKLRAHPDAQPEFQKLAFMMKEAYESSEPVALTAPDTFWHLPLVSPEDNDLPISDLCKVAVGRAARVSYLTHDGKRDPQADIDLCDRLLSSGHLSPFEHVARPFSDYEWNVVTNIQNMWRAEWARAKKRPDYTEEKGLWFDQQIDACEFSGNLRGWVSIRKQYQNENTRN